MVHKIYSIWGQCRGENVCVIGNLKILKNSRENYLSQGKFFGGDEIYVFWLFGEKKSIWKICSEVSVFYGEAIEGYVTFIREKPKIRLSKRKGPDGQKVGRNT